MTNPSSPSVPPLSSSAQASHFRFHAPHVHLASVFGSDWFALRAESFARFFGTPAFLVGQTIIVFIWIALNTAGTVHFDLYPFILLNLAFSLQAAYAAPLILLAQTRQADRDKAHADADAMHRETIAVASSQQQEIAVDQTQQLLVLMKQNTVMTELIKALSIEIKKLSEEMHGKLQCNTELAAN